jgi:NAD-dependent SIR2 family protein deacetylase
VKLVKKGKDPKTEIWKATCLNCKSQYEAERKELNVEDTQRDGAFAHARCQVCKKDMIFYPPRG